MSYSGHLIFHTQDAYGELRVLDNGEQHLLSFGPGDEQSACSKKNPERPIFEYIQAMLLPLLFHQPKKVLCLGLGAGSLVTILHKQCRGIKIDAVELRQAVIDTAYDYFYLPKSKQIQVSCQDAETYLQNNAKQYDLVFSDLYNFDGLDELQIQTEFLTLCKKALKPNGWLILNCWYTHQDEFNILQTLSQTFTEIWHCDTDDGNWIILASLSPIKMGKQALKGAAQLWSQRLQCSMFKHYRNLKQYT